MAVDAREVDFGLFVDGRRTERTVEVFEPLPSNLEMPRRTDMGVGAATVEFDAPIDLHDDLDLYPKRSLKMTSRIEVAFGDGKTVVMWLDPAREDIVTVNDQVMGRDRGRKGFWGVADVVHGILRRDVLPFAQRAACGGEIFHLGSQHPNGGSRVIS